MFIKIFQSDDAPCSDVYKAFLDLEDKIHLIPELDQVKKTYLVEYWYERDFSSCMVMPMEYPMSLTRGIWETGCHAPCARRLRILSLISQRLMEVQARRGKISWQVNTPCFGPILSIKEKKKVSLQENWRSAICFAVVDN